MDRKPETLAIIALHAHAVRDWTCRYNALQPTAQEMMPTVRRILDLTAELAREEHAAKSGQASGGQINQLSGLGTAGAQQINNLSGQVGRQATAADSCTEPPRAKPGDLVTLKSGGPSMTIAEIDGTKALCHWFTGGQPLHAWFGLELIA